MKLTATMKKTLLQIGFGVTCRENDYGGASYYDESGNLLDLRSANALERRRLVTEGTIGASPNVTILQLTEKGVALFEKTKIEEET